MKKGRSFQKEFFQIVDGVVLTPCAYATAGVVEKTIALQHCGVEFLRLIRLHDRNVRLRPDT